MNKSQEAELFDTHNQVLDYDDFPTGLPIDDGWYNILDTICYHIHTRINVIHWGYNHEEDAKINCNVRIIKLNRQSYGGRLTLEFDVNWTASPSNETKKSVEDRLIELQNLVETWSERTCELSRRPGQKFVSIDDEHISRILDSNVAKALNFVDESYHYEKQ